MHTENVITIDAPLETVFELAADVERWPELLSHYRYVRRVREAGQSAFARGPVYAMGATRSGIPVSWTSIQELDRAGGRILYHHVAGVTRGMDVEWRVERDGVATRASIDHHLVPRRWWLRPSWASHVVGDVFVMNVAQNTLRGIKRHAELAARESAVTR